MLDFSHMLAELIVGLYVLQLIDTINHVIKIKGDQTVDLLVLLQYICH